MKYLKLTAINILIASASLVCGQTVKYALPANRCSQSIISEDSFGRICITCGSQLYAFAPDGTLQFSFGRNADGLITSIDASNPMKIAVYFASSNMIYLIDNHGNPIGKAIDLAASGIFRASSIFMTSEGNIWLFDTESLTLRQLSPAGILKSQSSDISKFVNISNADSVRIAFSQNRIILAEGLSASVFSAEAAYIRSVTVPSGCRWSTISSSGAYSQCGDTVQLFHTDTFRTEFVGKTATAQPAFCSKGYFIYSNSKSEIEGRLLYNSPSGAEKTDFIHSSYLTE